MGNADARNLGQWIEYIQTLHHRQIELSLERVREVYQRLLPNGLACKVISISGTNGKGSTAELLASIYRTAGYKTGKYTSPHLVSFNERVNINGKSVDDESLLASFERIEQVRGDTPITFFEFGTLIAIDLFAQAKVDVAIMEVGLGGRLDAVNILDPELAIITSIAVDHTAWLGNTIEEIAFEKAGIARTAKPLLVGIAKVPKSISQHASKIGALMSLIGQDFAYDLGVNGDSWAWHGEESNIENLPLPFNQSGVQLSNCSLALQAVNLMQADLPVREVQIAKGISAAQLLGRCQVLSERPLIVLDVAHNEASVARLATFLRARFGNDAESGAGKLIAVCGMLKDKEISVSLSQVADLVDAWYCATIHNERGATSVEISKEINRLSVDRVVEFGRVEDAYEAAKSTLTEHDCLLVFGSFHIVGDILAHLKLT